MIYVTGPWSVRAHGPRDAPAAAGVRGAAVRAGAAGAGGVDGGGGPAVRDVLPAAWLRVCPAPVAAAAAGADPDLGALGRSGRGGRAGGRQARAQAQPPASAPGATLGTRAPQGRDS
jgi:hypothetical protein